MSQQLFLQINVSEKHRPSSDWCWSCARQSKYSRCLTACWRSEVYLSAFQMAAAGGLVAPGSSCQSIRAGFWVCQPENAPGIYLAGKLVTASVCWYVQCVCIRVEDWGLAISVQKSFYGVTVSGILREILFWPDFQAHLQAGVLVT